jgi:hypothetical protein
LIDALERHRGANGSTYEQGDAETKPYSESQRPAARPPFLRLLC